MAVLQKMIHKNGDFIFWKMVRRVTGWEALDARGARTTHGSAQIMIRYEVKHKCEEDTFDPLDKPYHLSKLTEHCNNCGEKLG